jgi:hypothetical protein
VFEVALKALAHGAAPDDVLHVAEDMARLGCTNARKLRAQAIS